LVERSEMRIGGQPSFAVQTAHQKHH
jgi:hypothetical protein